MEYWFNYPVFLGVVFAEQGYKYSFGTKQVGPYLLLILNDKYY